MGKYDKIEDNILELYLSETLVLVHSSCHLNVCLKFLNNSFNMRGWLGSLCTYNFTYSSRHFCNAKRRMADRREVYSSMWTRSFTLL